MQRRKHRNSASYRGPEFEPASFTCSQLQQIWTTARDQLLVRGDHRLSCLECTAHNLLSWIQSADQLDYDVRVGIENRFNIVSPGHIFPNPVLFFPLNVTIEDMSESKRRVIVFAKDLCDRSADGSKANQSNLGSRTVLS